MRIIKETHDKNIYVEESQCWGEMRLMKMRRKLYETMLTFRYVGVGLVDGQGSYSRGICFPRNKIERSGIVLHTVIVIIDSDQNAMTTHPQCTQSNQYIDQQNN